MQTLLAMEESGPKSIYLQPPQQKKVSPRRLLPHQVPESKDATYEFMQKASDCLQARNLTQFSEMLSKKNLPQEMLNTLLSLADLDRNLPAITLLIEQYHARGPFFEQWERGTLHRAVVEKFQHIKQNYLNKTNVNQLIAYKTPLMLAAAYNKLPVVKELLPFTTEQNRLNALSLALEYGAEEVIEPLIQHIKIINAQNQWGETPLYVAALHGRSSSITHLLHYGADASIATKEGSTPLHRAAINCSDEIISLLLTHNAPVNAETKRGVTPLLFACKKARISVVDMLLKAGSDINKSDVEGRTPLHEVVDNGDLTLVKLLLTNGAQVDKADNWNKTPLTYAQEAQNADICAELNSALKSQKRAQKNQNTGCCCLQ